MVNRQPFQCPSNRAALPRIAVIGDIMVDVDLDCSCQRLCQEGPWPVFRIESTRRRMGGAGNVAEMVSALGATSILLGLVGRDDCARLPASGASLGWQPAEGMTTTKFRVWVNGTLTGPRVDHDLAAKLRPADVDHFLQVLRNFAADAVIIADHGKGVITADLMRALQELRVAVFVDPLPRTPIPFRVTAIAGGTHELGLDGRNAECVIEKLGPQGVRWKSSEHAGEMPSACRVLVDPLGAGDQFIAVLAFEWCQGRHWPDAIRLANIAAGMQCERRGCAPVTLSDLQGFANTESSSFSEDLYSSTSTSARG